MIRMLLVLSSLSLTGPVGDLPKGWVEVKSKDGAVTFAMPSKPAERTITQKSPQGPIEVLEYSSTSDGCLYRLEKTPLPVVIPEGKYAGALKATRDSIAKKNKILRDQETTVAGWPAREFQIEAPLKVGAAPSKIDMLLFYADNELYQVRVFALDPDQDPKNVRDFFDSIKPKKERPAESPKL